MKLKLIICSVFTREICTLIAKSPHCIDLEFTELAAHRNSTTLRENLQKRIDLCETNKTNSYDAILLGYGICGNVTVGLKARKTKLVIPRAHDCCTIFLGRKSRFKDFFGDAPSTPFTTDGYIERGNGEYFHTAESMADFSLQNLIETYGEEYGKELFASLSSSHQDDHKKLIYINTLPDSKNYELKCQEYASKINASFQSIPGDLRLLDHLINGDWDEDEFLIVPSGKEIIGVYDWDKIIDCLG